MCVTPKSAVAFKIDKVLARSRVYKMALHHVHRPPGTGGHDLSPQNGIVFVRRDRVMKMVEGTNGL
jgi:hypothetical protein